MADTDRINTLFALPQLARGGSETLVYNLAKMMDRVRFNPSVVYFSSNEDKKFIQEFQESGIPVSKIAKTENIDFRLMGRLGKIVGERKIGVINAHHFVSMVYFVYACKKNRRTGLIYTEHSKWEIERIPLKWRIFGSFILSRIDGIIAVSREVAEAMRRNFIVNKTKVITIENGVDLRRFNCQYDRGALRSLFNLKPDDMVVGMVANFRKIKNHIFLVKAFRLLINEYPGLKLILVGKGFENDPEGSESEIREYVRDNSMSENVMFMGYRTDVPEMLGVMDMFCLPSLNEGLPISLIEAMASGLPVIGTKVDGIREMIRHGENGFLVDPSDAVGLQEALRALLASKGTRIEFGDCSRKLANESYSIDRCVNRYQHVFENVYFQKHVRS